MNPRRIWTLLLASLILSLACGAWASQAGAEGLSDDGGAQWRLEQPAAPEPPNGVEGAKTPVGLGAIGDIEFWAPNRGVLITAGNGSTVPAGVWEYNGQNWHELADVCGASDGRIAWAGPNEFWTISDGRPGQAPDSKGNPPPLEDDSLCRFGIGSSGKLEVIDSYASLAFLSTSYRAMDAATCAGPNNCWFSGAALPEPQVGAFQLHWNGKTLTPEPYLAEGHAITDMAKFEGLIYQSVKLSPDDADIQHPPELPALHVLEPATSTTFEPIFGLPLYGPGEFSDALDALHLSSDENSLWAAAGPALPPVEKSAPAGITLLHLSKRQYSREAGEYVETASPTWEEVDGPCGPAPTPGTCPENEPTGLTLFPKQVVHSIAAEPGTDSAWVSLGSQEEAETVQNPLALASIARISANGTVTDELQIPGDGSGPKGAAERIVCPATHDCWLATTRGWLFHLSTEAERSAPQIDSDGAFSGPLIAERPIDEGVPQQQSDAVPEDTSGLVEAPPPVEFVKTKPTKPLARVQVPLLADIRSRLVGRTTLQVSFHLSVKARVRLIAQHHKQVVARTATSVMKAGSHDLRVQLNVHLWPTKLDLQTHALAPLKTVTTLEAGTETISTSLVYPNLRAPLGSATAWTNLAGLGRL